MAALKNSDRDEVIRRILTETFAPRFSSLQKQVRGLVREKVKKEHPEFVALVKNLALRQYLAVARVGRVYIPDGDDVYVMAAPVYGKRVGSPTERRVYGVFREDYTLFKDDETEVPCNFGEFTVQDGGVLKEYRRAWADYAAACDELYPLLYGYNVREKFATDFPEFAKYLPALTVKARLPVVSVKDVRAQLSKFGIPAK